MKYNLTPKQKRLATFLVEQIRAEQLGETFAVFEHDWNRLEFESEGATVRANESWTIQDLVVLSDAGLIYNNRKEERTGSNSITIHHMCAIKGLIYDAVDSTFAEPQPSAAASAALHTTPPEISVSLANFRDQFPDATKLGFLILRFAAEKPYERIVKVIKETATRLGLEIVSADEREFHRNLLCNVKTYLHGCGFGIALYERINTDEPNANIGLEVGYLMAMNKPVLLLKDKTVPTLPTDLAGELYREFDPHDPKGTIPAQLTKWLEDYGIIISIR